MQKKSSKRKRKITQVDSNVSEGSNPSNVVAYCRVASSNQADMLMSIDQQRQQIGDYCREKGLKLVEIFKDRGVSGIGIGPSLEKAISRCRHGDIAALVVASASRLPRSSAIYCNLKRSLEEYGTRLVFAGGTDMSTSSTGTLLESVVASVSEYQSLLSSESTKYGMRKAKLNGKYVSRPPMGYRIQTQKATGLIPDNRESNLIKTIFSLARKHKGDIKQIAEYLGKTGVHNPRSGRSFSGRSLRRLLTNPVYIGLVRVDEETGFVIGDFEPIVDSELFNEVQELLAPKGTSE